ncbi:chromosome 11 open reading frame 30 [Plakobranchus ocellatus]|uniref:Chromosome 11 open reading frame 30 n=1 Tax=Plakobranchus ocellatus TaxID=259542 RepID=A0AAV4AYG3_9GAST|nr:chromosome 11 open reading frame 30 [Plakobranchus ocellatus]
MWPMLLDHTRDESKRILRRLELEAYASIISVFRAQGDLSKDKKSILQDLQQTLSISTERHRAEVRRAVNDEKLATIAENISGSMGTSEWQVEGRRLVPLMPRLVPQTAFTSTANQAASAMMEKNATLPPPASTCNKDGPIAVLPKTSRASSPSSNVVVLPSGTSIHIKGMLNQEEEEDLGTVAARRSSQRSLSTDSQNAASSVSTQTPRVTYTTASSTATGSSPVKITISKSPQGRPINVQSGSQPPKVILVTSSGPATTVVQRSMSVPVMRSQPSPMASAYPGLPASSGTGVGPGAISTPRSSVLVSGTQVLSTGAAQVVSAYPGVVTTASGASLVSTTVTMPTSSFGGNPALLSPSLQMGLGKVRPRIVPRQRYPAMVPQHQKPGVVLPMGPQLVSPLPQAVSLGSAAGSGAATPGPPHQAQYSSAGIQVNQLPSSSALHAHSAGVQVKTLNKPTIQIKQEGGMKIITQGSSSKILPKPSQLGNSSGPPVVMVNTGQGTPGSTTGITMLPRSISTYTAHSGGKVLNITTPGGRVIATTTKATNVVTVNPKTLHLTAVKSGSGSTTVSKPNVIVVQKTQHARFQSPLGGNIRTVTTSTLPGAIDKELMGLVHHKDSHGRHTSNPTISTASGARPGERRVIITTSGGGGEPVSIIHRGRSDSEGKTSSLLAELIQAAGIMPSDASVETVAQGTDPYDFDNTEIGDQRPGTQHHQIVSASASQVVLRQAQPSSTSAGGVFHTRVHQQHHLDGSNLDSLVEDKGSSQDSDSGTEQVLTLEQAMSLLNKEVVDLTESDPPKVLGSSTPGSAPHIQHLQAPAASSTNTSTSVLPPGHPSALPQAQSQPKVSILAKSKLLSGVVKEPPSSSLPPVVSVATPSNPASETSLSGVVTIVSPEEGLKEGQLDTQTGLFYQVGTPAAIRVRASQQIVADAAAAPPPSLSSSVVIVAGSSASTTTVTKASTSLSSTAPMVSQAHRQTPSLPATVTTTSPLTVVSAKLPPSTHLSTSLAAAPPPTNSSTVSGKAPGTASVFQGGHLDLLSSSLAQAEINFQDQEDEDEEAEGNVNDAMDNEAAEDENYEDYDDVDEDDIEPLEGETSHAFQATSLGEAACASGAGRPGMAEVLREETAKDGTLILTVSNPASSQPEICVSVSSTIPVPAPPFSSASSSSASLHGPLLVSLPSQLSRVPVPVALTVSQPQAQQPASNVGHFYSVLESQPANQPGSATGVSSKPVNPSQGLGVLPANEAASLPATALRPATSPSLGQPTAQQVGVLPIAVSVEPSGSVIAFNLDDLTSQQVLPQGDAETNTDIQQDDLGSAGSDPDSQSESLLVRSSKRKRKHNSGFDDPTPQANSWVKTAFNLLFRVARFKGSARDKNEIPAAEWFTFPVDPLDAPDYYTVVQRPMDFSTMRKKLETNQYNCFEEFQSDMDLIRSNCYLYNSEGTRVRRDCDEVMAFYNTELLKLQGKQALMQYSSSPLKKLKEDKSPQKH